MPVGIEVALFKVSSLLPSHSPKEIDQAASHLPAPLIIPRTEHNISRKHIDADALSVLYRLHKKGYIAYLVGGSVRDLLLGRRPKDFDISTSATPEEVRRLFRNSRIIGRRFRLVQVFFPGNKIVEVSTFRSLAEAEQEQTLVADNHYGTPAEDAWRRDLTINALFYNIADFSIVDYVGGMADLKNGLIRAVGEADLRFHQDPVRILRALRHAARTGFALTAETEGAVIARQGELAVCPDSRIRDELMRDLLGGACAPWLSLGRQYGTLFVLFPALAQAYGPADSPAFMRAQELMARHDASKHREEFLALAALLWPVLENSICRQQMGRNAWMLAVREELGNLLNHGGFGRRLLDRLCRAATPIYYFYGVYPKLPQRLRQKAYFADACMLAEFLGFDLANQLPSGRGRGHHKKAQPSDLAPGAVVGGAPA